MGNIIKKLYIGRQPILDAQKNIKAFELLYRKNPFKNIADFPNPKEATAHVLYTLSSYIEDISENKDVFINFDENSIYFPIEEFLNPEKVTIEILENAKIDERFIKRVKNLKDKGFKVALDDFILTEDIKNLIPLADFIKIDVLNTSKEQFQQINYFLKTTPHSAKLLAEKVEDLNTFEFFKENNYELFQGYFFSKPEIVEKSEVSPYYATLIQLFNELSKEYPNIKKIEYLIKNDINLSLSLLKYINSAYFSLRVPVRNIKTAVNLIGIKKIRAWILIMLYSRNFETDIKDNPILDLALMRGKILEILGEKNKSLEKDECYLTGILSLIDVAAGIEKKEILSSLAVSEELKTAVLEYKGVLGNLLKAVEFYEKARFTKADELLKQYSLDIKDMVEAEVEANIYVSSFKKMILEEREF